MGIGSKVAGITGLTGAGAAGAELLAASNKFPAFSALVNGINESVSTSVQATLSNAIGNNAPFALPSTSTALWGLAGGAVGFGANVALSKITGKDSKFDKTTSTLSGLSIGTGMGVATEAIAGALTTAGVTGMTYVASKKVIERVLDKYAPSYAYLAKYIALAPAATATSMFGGIDMATTALSAGVLAGGKLAFDGLVKNDAKGNYATT